MDNHGNSKGEMEYALVSRNWSLYWCQVTDEETAIYLQGLRELHYSFDLYYLVLFFVFLA